MGWEAVFERRIQEAQQAGAFDGLAGYGRPLILEDDPWADPTWRAVHHLMRNAGMAPQWIELDKELRQTLDGAREDLAWSARRGPWAEGSGWLAATRRFRERVGEMNLLIERINLLAPSVVFRRGHLDAEREIERVLTGVSRE